MNNIKLMIRKFLRNKNAITLITIVGCVGLVYFIYSNRINKATSPISLPYANRKIEPRTLVTNEMISIKKIPGTIVDNNVIRNKDLIVNKYVSEKYEIPANSLFYKESIVDGENLQQGYQDDIPEKHTIVQLPVDIETTYGNSIFTGNYIDLYYSTVDTDGKILIGKFIESIKVLAVTDGNFDNVFEKSDKLGNPVYLIFSVEEDMHLLLRKAMFTNGKLFPVPRNAQYSNNPGATKISSTYLKNLILSKTINVSDEDLKNIRIENPNNIINNNTTNNTNNNTNQGGE